MHECMLCKKDMKRSKNQFGDGCINNVYTFLDIDEKVKRKDKEKILYQNIMDRTNISKLNNNQKIWLTDRYLTYKYLAKLPYGNFEDLKREIDRDIKRMNNIKKFTEIHTAKTMELKTAYDLYKKERKFQTSLDNVKNDANSADEKLKLLLTSFSYIFNLRKHKNQYEGNAYSAMQFAFWQLVIEVGGKYFNYNNAAKLLSHSLEENPEDMVITEGKMIDKIIEDADFNSKINEILAKYGTEGQFNLEEGKESMRFSSSDLYFAIHKANITMSALKNSTNTWNLDITLIDPYDYTDFKVLADYYFDTDNIMKSILSSTLYNFAYCSMKLGVMKTYDVIVKLKIDNYEVK